MKIELEEKYASESIRDYSYRMLKKNIINFNLKPGEAISEATVSSVFGSSRTPIRETFGRLVNDGLLEICPQKATRIALIDEKRVRESLFMRRVQEEAIIAAACDSFLEQSLFAMELNLNQQKFYYEKHRFSDMFRLDNEMHELLFAGCQMEHIWMAMQSISADQNRIRHLRLESVSGWKRAIDEHEIMISLIKSNKPGEARQLMGGHISRIEDSTKECKNQHPEYFKGFLPEP